MGRGGRGWIDNDALSSRIWVKSIVGRASGPPLSRIVPSWRRCNFDQPYKMEIASMVDDHLALITKGCRAMIYNGDHDCKISYVGTQAWIRQLNLSITYHWRPWHVDDGVYFYINRSCLHHVIVLIALRRFSMNLTH
ncbi:hypothetical protein ZWY2020_039546 [Hordeum vulgare]|nr:hypothetical protein ZWY2020_039546 [Hordeum vulgare]